MFRQLAVVVVLACAVFAAPVIDNYEDIPAEYKSLIPTEVAEHLKSITPEEKAVLKELAKQHKDFANEEELLAALKEKSPSLYEKATKLRTFIKAKIDALGDEAKEFVKKIFAEGRELHRQYLAGTKPSLDELKTKVKSHIDAFKALSPAAKEEFKGQFPIISGALANPEVQALIDKYVTKN